MIRAVLFDLEGTLVSVAAIDHLREARRFRDYVAQAYRSELYAGVTELLGALTERSVTWAVVTNVPSMCAEAVLKHHSLEPHAQICYHDVKPYPKPHPRGCRRAMELLKVTADETVGVGDRLVDAKAYGAAGVTALGAGWNPRCEQCEAWAAILRTPRDVLKWV